MWEHRDMRDLPWKGEFDGAFCFGGSFGYFDEEGNAEFLKAVARSLKPGARFLVDTHVAETLLPVFRERDWQRMEDTLVITETHYDHVQGRVETEWTFVREGEMAKRPSSIRVYTYRELCQLLEEVGLTDCEGYGSLNGEPFGLGSRRLYLRAAKP
jgi:O-methyltransferase involved in polyketide biosynthesis